MTLEEFVRLDPSQVRKDERLMQLFVNFYEAAFSFKPKCAGCAFKKGFKKLRQYSTTGTQKITNFETMEAKTFKLKKKYWNKILTFKKNGITHRKYGNKIDEDFARELVASGQEDLFDKLPNTGKTKTDNVVLVKKSDFETFTENVTGYSQMDYRSELIPLYNEVSEKTGKEAISRKKEDIIDFLRENEN